MSWKKNQIIKFHYGCNSEIIPLKNPKSLKSWESNESLKKRIKNHYSIVQDDICAYCRIPLRFQAYGEPIEHIVPKSIKIKWMFRPENLCLSCYGCNTKKRDKNTLFLNDGNLNESYDFYPNKSEDFIINHPHFDSYSNNIVEENLICKAKTTKGYETIKICDLNRLDLIYTRARIKKISRQKINKFMTQLVLDKKTDSKEKEVAQKMIIEIIDRYNYYKKLVHSNCKK